MVISADNPCGPFSGRPVISSTVKWGSGTGDKKTHRNTNTLVYEHVYFTYILYIYTVTYIPTYMHACMHACIHIYIYTYIHTEC